MMFDNVCPTCKHLLSMCPQNMGMTDRLVRGVLGITILWLGIAKRGWWGLLGVYLIATAVLGFCPLYIPLHFNTKTEIPGPDPVAPLPSVEVK